VYAFEPKTGKVRWKLKASGPSTSFAEMDHAVVFGTREDEWIAVTVGSGKVNWKFSEAGPDAQCEIRTAPVTDGQTVNLVAHDGTLFALNGAGRKIWSQQPSSPVTTSLFIYKDVLYFGAADRHIYGLDPATGRPLNNLATPAIPKGRFAWGSRGGVETEYVFGIEKKDGQSRGMLLKFSDEFERVLWTQPAEREWTSEQPHVWKDWVIAGTCKGDIVAYGTTDGKQAWSEHVKGCIRSFGHDESTLYIGVQEGTVYAYRPPRPQSFQRGE
jgi:outer membrane protein assembly factor BamB